MHKWRGEDADIERQHACFDGGEKCDIDGLHTECQLKDEWNIDGDCWIKLEVSLAGPICGCIKVYARSIFVANS